MPARAAAPRPHLGGVFQQTFASSMATVFERGAAGEFDDPTLRLEEQAALERLRRARAAASETIGGAATVRGARGAPRAAGALDGGSGAAGTAQLAEEQRQLHDVRVRQSEARLANISASLARDFPLAASLAPASAGSWDPDTFVPRTAAEAEAFAHRMVIDATEGAARLEIVKTQLDAARFDAARGGDPAAGARAAELEAAYERQRAYVDKLSRIVDEQSGGQVADAGVLALTAGVTLRDSGDLPVHELAAELRASGMDEAQVRRVVGAAELAVEQERAPGGSERLRSVASDMTAALMTRFNLVREQRREEFRRQEAERTDERHREDAVAGRQRADELRRQQVAAREAQERRAAQRAAEFEQWLATLAAAAASRREVS